MGVQVKASRYGTDKTVRRIEQRGVVSSDVTPVGCESDTESALSCPGAAHDQRVAAIGGRRGCMQRDPVQSELQDAAANLGLDVFKRAPD
jgi:hypothetical protein